MCQGASPFGNPRQQNRRYAALSGSIPLFVVSSPFHGLFSPFVKFGVANVLGTFVYEQGILWGKFSYATAVGMVQGLISVILVFITMKAANKVSGESYIV